MTLELGALGVVGCDEESQRFAGGQAQVGKRHRQLQHGSDGDRRTAGTTIGPLRFGCLADPETAGHPAIRQPAPARLRGPVQWDRLKCTGCGVCVDVCPAKSKSETKYKAIEMQPIAEHLERERARFDAFLRLAPEAPERQAVQAIMRTLK